MKFPDFSRLQLPNIVNHKSRLHLPGTHETLGLHLSDIPQRIHFPPEPPPRLMDVMRGEVVARPVIKVSPRVWRRYSNNLTHQYRKQDQQDLLVGFPAATVL